MTEETQENTEVEVAAEAAAPVEAAPAEAPAKTPIPPKVQSLVYMGAETSRENTVYDRIRQFVGSNPGLAVDDLVDAIIAGGFKADNSKQFDNSPKAFIRGYVVTGLRKGYFSATDQGIAYAAGASAAKAGGAKPSKAKSSLPESAGVLLGTIGGEVTEVGVGVSIKVVAEKTGKPKSYVTKAINKLVELGLVEKDEVQVEEKPVEMVFLTEAGLKAFNELVSAVEPSTEEAPVAPAPVAEEAPAADDATNASEEV